MDWEEESINTSLENMQKSFTHDLEEVQLLSDRIYVNNQVHNILETQFTDIQQLYSAYSQINFLESYLHLYPQVENFRIYTENSTLLDNSFIVKTPPRLREAKWYADAINAQGQSFWIYKTDSISQKDYLCLIRSLWSSSGLFLGVLTININPEFFNNRLQASPYDSLIFIDSNMFVSTVTNVPQKDMHIFFHLLNSSEEKLSKIHKTIFNNQNFGVSGARFKAPGNVALKIVFFYLFPMQSIYRHFASFIIFAVVILFLFAIFSMGFFLAFSTYLERRFKRINHEVKHIVDKNFEIKESIGGRDEFAQIYQTIYKMSLDIKRLIAEVYQQNIEKQQLAARQNEIRFKMLSTQINPHFLFNTIETIRMKALSSGQKEIATMLRMLASLLRYNLSVKGSPVPLSKELEAVDNYLKIQQMRFGSRVSYEVLVTGNQDDVMVLPLLIQPLVENSFSHGLEDRLSGGMIYIIINVCDSPLEENKSQKSLDIIVKDNGCGIPEEKLQQLRENLALVKQEDTGTSIGIENVNSRIKLYYGNEYGMKIESKTGEGTTVTLHFALKNQQN
ncbi:MAG: sensor histidine kinase [Treponema sp.]|nr:sensor histidine kinase [Treponema sp.]